jgi:regulator of sigma E protease
LFGDAVAVRIVAAAGIYQDKQTAELKELGKTTLAGYLGAPLAARIAALVPADKPLYLLGIVPTEQPDVLDVGVVGAAKASLEFPVDQTKLIVGGFYDIIAGNEKADPGGPKRIFDEFAKAWKLGAITGIKLLMLLSVYLGLFNLFPLPALDGGRLVFLSYELVTRRRANPKIEAMVHMAGIMVLLVVMVLVTLHDFHLWI